MPILALSTAESELAAVVKGTSEGLGIQAALADFGRKVLVEIKSDATAAIGICRRQGLGRIRHLATADLWVQQIVRHKKCTLSKHPGTDNPADMLTKHLPKEAFRKYAAKLYNKEISAM